MTKKKHYFAPQWNSDAHKASRTTGFCLIKIVCRSASHWDSSRNEISKGLNPANLWSCNNEGFPLHFDLFVIKYQMTEGGCLLEQEMDVNLYLCLGGHRSTGSDTKYSPRLSAGKVTWNNLIICLLTLKVNCHHILFQGSRIKII